MKLPARSTVMKKSQCARPRKGRMSTTSTWWVSHGAYDVGCRTGRTTTVR